LKPKSVKDMEQSLKKSKEITRMLQEWSGGKQEALDALLPLVYEELHRQASRYLHRERAGHTLQTTALSFQASAATRSPLAVTPWRNQAERRKREPCLRNYQNYQPNVTFRHITLR
jgi:response regulator of citrate/malate metabolism